VFFVSFVVRLSPFFQQARREFERRFAFAAEHPRDFFLPRFPSDFMQTGKRAAARDILSYNKM
jgi:hypothetical protein